MFIALGDGGAGGLQTTSSTLLQISSAWKRRWKDTARQLHCKRCWSHLGPRTFPCCIPSRVQSLWIKQFVCPQNVPNTAPSRGLVSMWSLQAGECNHTFSTVNCDANPHSLHQHLRKIASAKSGGSRFFSLQLFKKNVEWWFGDSANCLAYVSAFLLGTVNTNSSSDSEALRKVVKESRNLWPEREGFEQNPGSLN